MKCLEIQTINSNKYYSKLDQLKATLDKKHLDLFCRKHIIFYQNTPTMHVSLMTRQKVAWEVLIHPLYSPDIAPLDFHFFQFLQNSFNV